MGKCEKSVFEVDQYGGTVQLWEYREGPGMKTILLIVVSMMLVGGCASAPKPVDPNYQNYLSSIKPMVAIEWSEDGTRIKKLEVNPAVQQRQPDAPHPAWSTVNRLISAVGIVGGIWAFGQAQEGIIESGRGTTTIEGSYNQPGGNMAGGNVEIPTTTTTTTTTETTTTGVPE